jgi:D-alanyl-D-alanine dipeptidase
MLIINILKKRGHLFCCISICFLAFSCIENSDNNKSEKPIADSLLRGDLKFDTIKVKSLSKVKKVIKIDSLEQRIIDSGLVDIQEVDSTILIDVKYSSLDNFMKKDLYGSLNRIYLQKEVAERLSTAQKALKEQDSTLSLLVFDGVRPRSVQQRMWDALDTIPFHERIKFVSNPKNGSLHSYGCAVDLTIYDHKTDTLLDMGAGYDDLRKIAYPRYEEEFLESGELTKLQYRNRKLLRSVMRKGGFWVIATEWWHFNAFSREKAKELYEVVE